MKVLLASVLVVLAHAEEQCEQEQSSMLQSKKDHFKAGSDLIGTLLERGAHDLSTIDSDADVTEVEQLVASFSQKLKNAATSLLQMPNTEQTALLRRASQGTEVAKFITKYVSLPVDTKEQLIKAVVASEEMASVYESLPAADRRVLLMQLGSKDVEQVISGKTTHYRDSNGNLVTRTETKNGRGGTVHTHTQSAAGGTSTETATKDKNGNLVHRHVHKYNPNTGKTETSTQSKNHGHTHTHQQKNGATSTGTVTVSNGQTHGHTHATSGGDTVTRTNDNGKVTVSSSR
jgi:hypothetical protein